MRRLAVSAVLSLGLVGSVPLDHSHDQSHHSHLEKKMSEEEFKAWALITTCLPEFLPKIYPEKKEGWLPYFYNGKRPHECPHIEEQEIIDSLRVAGIEQIPKEKLKEIVKPPTEEQWGKFWEKGDIHENERQGFMELPQSGLVWDDRHIPYCRDANLGILANFVISLAVSSFNANTLINLVPIPCGGLGHKLRFQPGAHPQSNVGRRFPLRPQANDLGGGLLGVTYNNIDVNIFPPYFFPVVYQHEIIHTLGFKHTHQRNDANVCLVMAGYNALADVTNCGPAPPGADVGVYDYNSIMHYPNLPIHLCGIIAPQLPQPAACHGTFGFFALNLWGMSNEDVNAIHLRYPNAHNAAQFF